MNPIEETSIIMDTGSTYNLIGQQLLPILNERLHSGGQNIKLEDTLKYFKFGGHDDTTCRTKVTIPLNFAGIMKDIEVYIIPAKVFYRHNEGYQSLYNTSQSQNQQKTTGRTQEESKRDSGMIN